MENTQRPAQFAKSVLPIFRRVERVSFNVLRALGLLVLACLLVGLATGG